MRDVYLPTRHHATVAASRGTNANHQLLAAFFTCVFFLEKDQGSSASETQMVTSYTPSVSSMKLLSPSTEVHSRTQSNVIILNMKMSRNTENGLNQQLVDRARQTVPQ